MPQHKTPGPQHKTPGVYIVEENAFPNSVVEVPTAIPVFIGYTETANVGGKSLLNLPFKISSLNQYIDFFGGNPPLNVTNDKKASKLTCNSPFLMSRGIRFFYENGGGDCYVLSVGGYTDDAGKPTTPDKDTIIGALKPLAKAPEPSMILTPDSAMMSIEDWGTVTKSVLMHCKTHQNRIAILDLINGNENFNHNASKNPVSEFYNTVGTNGLNYAAAYYPWLNTNMIEYDDITFLNLDADLKKTVQKQVAQEAPNLKELANTITTVKTITEAKQKHLALTTTSPTYQEIMSDALVAINIMPPSTAMAGIICFTDNQTGPWKAPANTSFTSVSSPTVNITSDQQQQLNAPLNGLSINAIRSFPNRGVLVWGARTLDGNSQDWRYISVRRTLIMIEQSAKLACQSFVFEPNDANTWASVKSMIQNFLTDIWKQGALMGATAEQAFSVEVGLGSTMTQQDILDGKLMVTIFVAPTHPAEFIVLTFQQQQQSS